MELTQGERERERTGTYLCWKLITTGSEEKEEAALIKIYDDLMAVSEASRRKRR